MKNEKYSKLLEDLKKEVESGVCIIVEGRRDVAKLQLLGIKGRVYILKSKGKRLYQVAEEAVNQSHKVIILTDVDRAGNELAKRLAEMVTSFGGVPELKYRGLMRVSKTKAVEELPCETDSE